MMKRNAVHLMIVELCLMFAFAGAMGFLPGVEGQITPKHEVDAVWAKLPERWVVASVGAVCVDAQDHVFIINRGGLTDKELDAGISAPPVIEFDPQGNVVHS